MFHNKIETKVRGDQRGCRYPLRCGKESWHRRPPEGTKGATQKIFVLCLVPFFRKLRVACWFCRLPAAQGDTLLALPARRSRFGGKSLILSVSWRMPSSCRRSVPLPCCSWHPCMSSRVSGIAGLLGFTFVPCESRKQTAATGMR